MSETKSRFSKTEKIVISLAAVFLIGGVVIWVTDFPIGQYLLGLTGGASQKEVGKLERTSGNIRREQATETDFQDINVNTSLFNEDTVVTAPETNATLRLNDGSALDMAPGTMIRLSFEDNLGLGGVNRTVNVEVVKGSVSGTASSEKNKIILKGAGKTVQLEKSAKTLQATVPTPPKPVYTPPPVPSPTPVITPSPVVTPSPSPTPSETPVVERQTRMTFPKEGAHLKVADGSEKAEVPVTFSWSVTPPPETVQFEVIRDDKKPVTVFRKDIPASETGSMTLPLSLKIPGKYHWIVQDATETQVDAKANRKEPRRYGRASFVVDPDFKAIVLDTPLVGGKNLTSSTLQDSVIKNFDITLPWQPYGKVKDYIVSFFTQPDAPKPAMEKLITGNSYSMNKNKVFQGKVYYEVSAQLPNGFIAHSERQQFTFAFAPPTPVSPQDHAQISVKDLATKENRILFTWQKTNFTESYEIAIASDPTFQKVLIKRTTPENFFVLKAPKLGTYYWRVVSISGTTQSDPSTAAQLDVVP